MSERPRRARFGLRFAAVLCWVGGGLLAVSSCVATRPLRMPQLASSQVASDLDTYTLRRVGVMPFRGTEVDLEQGQSLQAAFHSEFSQAVPFELVPLADRDLEEIVRSEPHRRGWYRPETIIQVSDRYQLDGILFGTVTQQRFYPPQILSVQVELVSAETGLVLWSSAVHLDGADPRVQDGLQLFFGASTQDVTGSPSWQLSMLSPERFARFAAYQIAREY